MAGESQQRDTFGGAALAGPRFMTFSYGEHTFNELESVCESRTKLDGLIIDLLSAGATVKMDELVRFESYARRLLTTTGVMMFLQSEGTMTFVQDELHGGFNCQIYDNPVDILARHPALAQYICATIPGVDRRRMREGGNTLANHILYTSTPVLTVKGQKILEGQTLPALKQWLLRSIDGYTTVEALSKRMEQQHGILPDQVIRGLQEFENYELIFPLFSRITFLSRCYRSRKPFRLGTYMVEAGIIKKNQLQELLERQQQEGVSSNRIFLGLLAVKAGLLTHRELELLLQDQHLYGGYDAVVAHGAEGAQLVRGAEESEDSLIGSLKTMQTSNLLQSIATSQKTGLLNVESRDRAFLLSFAAGRPVAARMGKIKGRDAVIEFITTWQDGFFVFREKAQSDDRPRDCNLSHTLDKLLLDSALAQDQMNQILARLPERSATVLERVWNFETLWEPFRASPAQFIDETSLTDSDKQFLLRLAGCLDGLSNVLETSTYLDDTPSYTVLKALDVLVRHDLVKPQQAGVFKPLHRFQRLITEISVLVGAEDNKAILKASLHYAHGDSESANRFYIDPDGRIGLNIGQVRKSGIPVSVVINELKRWMDAYLAYCRRVLDAATVDQAVRKVGD